jgi:hypothetical protein
VHAASLVRPFAVPRNSDQGGVAFGVPEVTPDAHTGGARRENHASSPRRLKKKPNGNPAARQEKKIFFLKKKKEKKRKREKSPKKISVSRFRAGGEPPKCSPFVSLGYPMQANRAS